MFVCTRRLLDNVVCGLTVLFCRAVDVVVTCYTGTVPVLLFLMGGKEVRHPQARGLLCSASSCVKILADKSVERAGGIACCDFDCSS